jgi:hypothetical protein
MLCTRRIMNIIVCDAIRTRRLLRFVYDGYERVIEPHAYGVNSAGHEAVSGWLTAGWSASTPEPGWRMYLLEQMHDVAALAEPFDDVRPVFKEGDPHFVRIYCQVARDA